MASAIDDTSTVDPASDTKPQSNMPLTSTGTGTCIGTCTDTGTDTGTGTGTVTYAGAAMARRRRTLFAAADGSSHSLLRAQTSAWYAALPGAHDDAHAPDEDIDGSGHGAAPSKSGPSKLGHSKLGGATVRVEALLEAFSHTLKIFEAFGPLLLLVVKNDEANLEKMQRAWRDLEAADGSQRLISLRELLEAERASGIHRAGGVLADPSAAIALVWLRRSLAFQNAVFAGMVEDRASLLSTLARDAYQTHLEHFHNFWLKNTFRAGLSAMPKREDFLQRLSPNMRDEEREQLVYAEMSELVEVQMRVCAACSKLMIDLDLEDLRRV